MKHIPVMRTPRKRSSQIPALIIILLLMTACQPATSAVTSLPFFPTHTPVPQFSPTITDSAAITTLVPAINQAPTLAVSSPTPTSQTPAATQPIINPTQSDVELSSWRPPLYPDPWAPTMYDHFFFFSPIAANEVNTPVFDYRYGGVFFEDTVHTGIDIPAPKGTPILAAGPGTVVWAGYGVYQGGYDPRDPYGLAVTIQHDFGYQNQMLFTVYGHMDEIDVVTGQHVDTGDLLGLVGETGMVTGPHLHFEVRIGKNDFFVTRNPELWLVPPIGWGIIAGRMMDTVGQPLYDQQLIITDPEKELNWFAWSYGKSTVNSDPYYQENLVIGDIPAGNYLLRVAFGGMSFSMPITVYPGMVNYFTFNGYYGFSLEPPLPPGADFTPQPIEAAIP
jgi:murein DD-endopeptidase MepM/ murein hydrolase activator NlpD